MVLSEKISFQEVSKDQKSDVESISLVYVSHEECGTCALCFLR